MKAGRITPLDGKRNSDSVRMNHTSDGADYATFTTDMKRKYSMFDEKVAGGTSRGQFEI